MIFYQYSKEQETDFTFHKYVGSDTAEKHRQKWKVLKFGLMLEIK